MPDPVSTITPAGSLPVQPAVYDEEAETQVSSAGPAFLFDMAKKTEVDWMHNHILASDDTRRRFVDVWDEIWLNYLVNFPDGYIFPLRNQVPAALLGIANIAPSYQAKLKDPETHQVVETLAAMGIGLIFGSRDYLQATPIGIDDPEKARLMTRLIMAVLEQPGMFRTLYQVLKSAFIFGTSILEVGWETLERPQVIRKPIFDPFGRLIGRNFDVQNVRYKDGPLLREVDIYDWYPDFAGTRIQEDMTFVAKRFRITKHKALAMANAGIYDMDDVKLAIRIGEDQLSKEPQTYPDISGVGYQRTLYPERGHMLPQKYGQMTGFEGWGDVPFREPDGYQNRVITVLNGVRVRSHLNPFIDGFKPFKEFIMNPIPGRHYGLAPAEVIRFLQDSADNLLMVFNDAADLAVHMPLLMGNAFGGDPDRLKRRNPLDIIECNDPNAVKPLPVDTNVLTFAAAEMMRRKMTMREAAGAPNPTQGIESPTGEQTATEVSTISRFATQRIELMTQVIEKDDLPWLGRCIANRIRQFIPDEGAIATLAGDQFRVRLDDIDFDSDVRFVGSRQAISKFQNTARYREALNVLGTNPEIVMMYPDLVTRYFRDGLDMADAENVVKAAILAYQQKMMAEYAMQAGQAGELLGQEGSPTSAASQTGASMDTEESATQQEGQAIS
jgi:hypothetical protein